MLLWHLWELLVSEQPILVVANDPHECSHAVMTVLSLIHPLTTSADVRPYLTVLNNDTEVYSDLVRQGQIPNAIIGVANPLLMKKFENFPTILHLDNLSFVQNKQSNPASKPLTESHLKNKKSALKEALKALKFPKQKFYLKP